MSVAQVLLVLALICFVVSAVVLLGGAMRYVLRYARNRHKGLEDDEVTDNLYPFQSRTGRRP